MDAVINFKTNAKLKKQAQEISARLGISLSSVLNNTLRKLVAQQQYNFEEYEIPNERLEKSIEMALNDEREGNLINFKKTDDAVDYINQMIKDEEN